MRKRLPARKPAVLAFSLLEVLVASAILGIVMMVLLSTLTTSLSLWRNTESKSLADREARAAEMWIKQDLANVYMGTNANLWPRTNNSGGNFFLQFLTLNSPDYDPASLGDLIYVEYSLAPASNAIMRFAMSGQQTFDTILKAGNFNPRRRPTLEGAQLLAANVLTNNRDAARGTVLGGLADTDYFVLLSTNHRDQNLLPMVGAYDSTNYPAAIEVNFAVADPDTLRNTEQLNNPNYILRNAGLYSTRFYLPKPPNAP
jgi:type II secretory pathway pseudopilin PulG